MQFYQILSLLLKILSRFGLKLKKKNDSIFPIPLPSVPSFLINSHHILIIHKVSATTMTHDHDDTPHVIFNTIPAGK